MSGTTDQRMAYNPHDFKDQIDWKIKPHAKFDHFDRKSLSNFDFLDSYAALLARVRY